MWIQNKGAGNGLSQTRPHLKTQFKLPALFNICQAILIVSLYTCLYYNL